MAIACDTAINAHFDLFTWGSGIKLIWFMMDGELYTHISISIYGVVPF